MSKSTKLSILVGSISIACVVAFCGASLYSWNIMQEGGAAATGGFLGLCYSVVLGGMGVVVPLLISLVFVFAVGPRKAWFTAVCTSILAVAIVFATERIAQLFFGAAIIQSKQFYLLAATGVGNVFYFMLPATLYYYAIAQAKQHLATPHRLDKSAAKDIGLATLCYAMWFAVICIVMFLSARYFGYASSQGISPREGWVQPLLKYIELKMTGITGATGWRILILLPVMLYIVFKRGRLCAIISWITMVVASCAVAYAAAIGTHIFGFDGPGIGNYTMHILPSALSLFYTLALSIFISSAASWSEKRMRLKQ